MDTDPDTGTEASSILEYNTVYHVCQTIHGNCSHKLDSIQLSVSSCFSCTVLMLQAAFF